MKRPDTKLITVFFILLAAAFFLIKYQSPSWVKMFYANGTIVGLNDFLNLYQDKSLNYYLGRYEDVVFGPLCQVISGMLFVAFSLLYLRETRFWKFTLAVFVYLTLTKLEVLFFPPYGDAIGGPFMESLWLAKNNFDYVKLFHQPSYAEGGPRVYMFSIYPTYLGALIALIKPVKLFLAVNHLLVFFMTAVIAALLREVMLKLYSPAVATLAAFLFLYLPVTQTQTEAINMEVPCLLFVMLSAYYAAAKKFPAATGLAVAAVLVKGTGVLACAAIFALSFLVFFFDEEQKRNVKVLLSGFFLMGLAVVAVWLKFLTRDQHVVIGGVQLFRGWESIKYHDPHMHSFIAAALLFCGYCLVRLITRRFKWKEQYVPVVMFLFGIMWVLLFLNFYTITYRYRVILYPFMVFGVLYMASLILRGELWRRLGLLSFILIALLNSYGMFTNNYSEHNHVLLERSLEYRNDLKVNQMLSRAAAEKYNKFTIGAPFMLAQILAFPELGYVSKPLNVMIYGYYSSFEEIPNYPGLSNLNISRTVYMTKLDEQRNEISYPLSEKDIVIDRVEYGTKSGLFFMGGIAIEQAWRGIMLQRLLQQRQP